MAFGASHRIGFAKPTYKIKYMSTKKYRQENATVAEAHKYKYIERYAFMAPSVEWLEHFSDQVTCEMVMGSSPPPEN